jgi:hypothetical protein
METAIVRLRGYKSAWGGHLDETADECVLQYKAVLEGAVHIGLSAAFLERESKHLPERRDLCTDEDTIDLCAAVFADGTTSDKITSDFSVQSFTNATSKFGWFPCHACLSSACEIYIIVQS